MPLSNHKTIQHELQNYCTIQSLQQFTPKHWTDDDDHDLIKYTQQSNGHEQTDHTQYVSTCTFICILIHVHFVALAKLASDRFTDHVDDHLANSQALYISNPNKHLIQCT